MAKFIFRFKTVLQHRCNIEQQRQRELAQVLHAQMILMDQLRTMQETIRQSKQQLGAGLLGKVDLESISRFTRYSAYVTERGRQIVVKLAELDKRIQQVRARLLEATKQRKAMELLRDKHYQQWLGEENRRQNIEMDEIATQIYMRNQFLETVK